MRIALAGIATATVAGFIIKDYYTHRLTATARLLVLGLCTWSLFIFLTTLWDDKIDLKLFAAKPEWDQRDSILMLPAYCFLDKILNGLSIKALRDWMDSSQWLERKEPGQNVENDINTVGQLAPLFALGATAVIFLDKISHWTRKVFNNRQLDIVLRSPRNRMKW
ncbi:hypothetical protein PG996_009081 [Apiospora saccharicola]|uniref:Uncharacterized protein n=1 Tax=Apiospora saccharicola TaxID=335842 RepID=A0ABR1UM46_9PEZI